LFQFITLLDQLKLNIRAVDELFPSLSELEATITAMVLRTFFCASFVLEN
jgi:hypothetical protein